MVTSMCYQEDDYVSRIAVLVNPLLVCYLDTLLVSGYIVLIVTSVNIRNQ